MGKLVIRDGAKIKGTLGSGAGDDLLTRESSTQELRVVPGGVTALTQNYIFVGNASNVPTATAVSGDITNTLGNFQIAAGVIVNADVNATAGIALTKLASTTASRALTTDGSGFIVPSSVTATELGFVSGVSSSLQTQLNAKQATITGAATTVVAANLTASRAVISNGSGKIDISTTTSTELGYVSGVTSAIQTQIDTKLTVNLTGPVNGAVLYRTGGEWVNLNPGTNGYVLTLSGGVPVWSAGTSNGIPTGGTTSQYLIKNSNTNYDAVWSTLVAADITDVVASADDLNILNGADGVITSTELGYLAGVSSPIQTQLAAKQSTSLAYNSLWVGNGSNIASQLSAGSDSQVLTIVSGAPVWQDPTPPGNVSGVAPSVDNALVRWNGALADSIQNSGIIIDDSDNITAVASLRTINQGGIILRELTASGTNAITLRAAGTMAGDYTITLPAAAPAGNTFLKYDGADYVWAAGGGGGTSLNQKTETGTTYTVTDADDGYVIYFTNVAGCTVTLPNTITTNVSFTTVFADGGSTVAHVTSGGAVLYSINSEVDIETENGSATWVKRNATDFYGWGALGPAGGGTVTSVTGTTNRITSTGGSTPVLDIAATYVGQASITTLGTIATGVWQGTAVGFAYGGTGLTALGTASQLLRVNAGATALEYFTPTYISGNQTITLTGDVTGSGTTGIATTIAANVVDDAKFRQSVGLSVVGRTTNSTGNVADITAASDGQILRRSGTSIGFGSIDLASSAAVGSSILPIANGGTGGSTGPWLLSGTNTLTGAVTVTRSYSGTGTFLSFTPTITATANSQSLTGVSITLTPVPGAFISLNYRPLVLSAASSSLAMTWDSGGVGYFDTSNSGGNYIFRNNGNSNILMTSAGLVVLNGANSMTTGTGVVINPSPTNAVTGGVTMRALSVQPAINFTGGTTTYTGIQYNPTLTAVTGITHYGILSVPTAALNGFGTATPTATMHVVGSTRLDGAVTLPTAGNGILIKEGSNATMGVATLVAGTVTINTTKVTANSRIFLTTQTLGTVLIPAAIGVTTRTAATSFTITSSDVTDTSSIAWVILEPA
jgi:hypothetical protein